MAVVAVVVVQFQLQLLVVEVEAELTELVLLELPQVELVDYQQPQLMEQAVKE